MSIYLINMLVFLYFIILIKKYKLIYIYIAFAINGIILWGIIGRIIKIPKGYSLMSLFLFSLIAIFFHLGIDFKIYHKKKKVLINFFVFWFIFLLYILVRSTFNLFSSKKILLLIIKGLYPVSVLGILYITEKDIKKHINKIFTIVFQNSLILSLLVTITYLISNTNYRITYGGFDPITFSRGIVFGIFILTNIQLKRSYKLISFFTLLLGLIVSGTRAALLGLILVFIYKAIIKLFLLIKNKKLSIINMSFYFIISLIIIAILLFNFDIFINNYISRNGSELLKDKNVSSRLQMYNYAYKEFKSNFFIGIGLDNYNFSVHDYPHNLILELLAELGTIGFILYFLGLKPINMFYNNMFSNVFLLYFIFSMFSFDIGGNGIIILLSFISFIFNKRYNHIMFHSLS